MHKQQADTRRKRCQGSPVWDSLLCTAQRGLCAPATAVGAYLEALHVRPVVVPAELLQLLLQKAPPLVSVRQCNPLLRDLRPLVQCILLRCLHSKPARDDSGCTCPLPLPTPGYRDWTFKRDSN